MKGYQGKNVQFKYKVKLFCLIIAGKHGTDIRMFALS